MTGTPAPRGKEASARRGRIRVGIGGWVYAPWRGTFYPKGLPQARELDYASRQITSIEINSTFYGTQKAASFRRWRDETPDDFVFAVKGPRYATHRRPLAEAGASVERFFGSGVLELGDKLGPVLWQFPPTTRLAVDDFAAFLALLPKTIDGRRIRHVVEVRNDSFANAGFAALVRRHGAAIAFVESDKHPLIQDVTADFVYARLERSSESEPSGYAPRAIDAWARRFEIWAAGGEPDDAVRHGEKAAPVPRDVFAYFISGAKERNPAAATALIKRLG